MNKQVFITYSWDTEEHKVWVRNLADLLISEGIMVYLDQYDLKPGESFTHFMESSITKSDRVIVVLTPSYKDKSLERRGGVGYEQQIISGEIMSGIDRKKFIPIMKEGKYEEGVDCALPPHFKGIVTLDFTTLENERDNFDELLRAIYDEPKLIKPPLGIKPNFKQQALQKSFTIELDENFNCLQSEIFLTDLFLQISDLRKIDGKYDLSFIINSITDEVAEYFELASLQNPSGEDIKRKLQLRSYLDGMYFLPNGTLYEYLHYSINSIIDFSFNKYKYIFKYKDLFVTITKCLTMFSDRDSWKRHTTKFDVSNNKIEWGFSIWISESEVQNLLSKMSMNNKMCLTAIAGLDIYDLSHSTLIEEVIPKESYKFTIDYFLKKVNEEIKEECFRIGNWKIGLG